MIHADGRIVLFVYLIIIVDMIEYRKQQIEVINFKLFERRK